MFWLAAAAAVGFLIWRDLTTPRAPALAAGSGSAVAPEPPPVRPIVDAAPSVDAPGPVPPDAPAAVAPLYTITEALDDVASSPLVFVGTGEGFGNYSIHACVYRNARILAVNVYCTAKETPAFSLVVLSPTRGRATVYAEADAAISTLARDGYDTFRVEAQQPVEDPLSLSFTYAELRAWDERRYNTYAPACTVEARATCSPELEPLLEAWAPAGEAFLAAPPPAWFRLVKDLHARAVRDSRAR